jgi:Peptidase family S41
VSIPARPVLGMYFRIAFFLVAISASTSAPLTAAEKNPGKPLTDTILTHVHERLPNIRVHERGETDRVLTFANDVLRTSIYQIQPGQLEAAAIAAIDAASNESATASSLIRAAMAGVLDSMGHGARLVPTPPKDFKPEETHASIRDIGGVRVIGLPTLNVTEELHDLLYGDPLTCEGFKPYFNFSRSDTKGVVLDLRGNQGGPMTAVTCLASAFLKPGLPLIVTLTRQGLETDTSQVLKWEGSTILPVVVFIDQETDRGAIALAAALQDQKRATIIGEQKATINGTAVSLLSTPHQQDWFAVPAGDLRHVGGQRLETAGVRVDVPISPGDEKAMMAAAQAVFAKRSQ